MSRRLLWFLAIGLPLTSLRPTPEDPKRPAYAPTEKYETREVEGWTVLVHRDFLRDQPGLAKRTLYHLGRQLAQVRGVVPEPALESLRRVRIWVEEREPHHPCMAYHPDAGWLRDHGMNPDKAKCVEVANARNFLDWSRTQPWMVLHELAHAYHHQALPEGFENPDVRRAFRESGHVRHYGAVPHVDGTLRKAYAATNPMEYFAEGTEAFFGTNDFYPFRRDDLRSYDILLLSALERLWGVGEGASPRAAGSAVDPKP